jgi:hypothetical protein
MLAFDAAFAAEAIKVDDFTIIHYELSLIALIMVFMFLRKKTI